MNTSPRKRIAVRTSFHLILSLTLILGAVVRPSFAHAGPPDAAEVSESLAYLRDHANAFADTTPATKIKRHVEYMMLIGGGALFVPLLVERLVERYLPLSHKPTQWGRSARAAAIKPNPSSVMLSVRELREMIEQISPHLATLGLALLTGGALLHLIVYDQAGREQTADLVELRRKHAALVELLHLPADEALAKVVADQEASAWIVRLANASREQTDLWSGDPVIVVAPSR